MLFRNLFGFIAIFCISAATSFCFAKNINLYDQPKSDAKVVGSVDPELGIIPIFTPKNKDWIKVGDPRNGNVGWVKSSDLNSTGKITFTQQIINAGSNPHSFSIQFGTPEALSAKQTQAVSRQIQTQQELLQKNIQQMMNSFNQQNWLVTPVIMPIMYVQEPAKPSVKK